MKHRSCLANLDFCLRELATMHSFSWSKFSFQDPLLRANLFFFNYIVLGTHGSHSVYILCQENKSISLEIKRLLVLPKEHIWSFIYHQGIGECLYYSEYEVLFGFTTARLLCTVNQIICFPLRATLDCQSFHLQNRTVTNYIITTPSNWCDRSPSKWYIQFTLGRK